MFGIPVGKLVVVGGVGAVAVLYLISGNKGAGAAPGGPQCQYQVTADALNVRSGPGTGNRIVDSYRHGAEITADRLAQNGWRRVDDTHWVSNDYLTPAPGKSC
ncbi:hypothetical protein GCM10010174_09910 [Kutzneria viridogrisea]|uniref:Uncharacterized protein n=2 Tax=Kutzneria TaxID=43356 RepID=W5WKL7_9PSEU|nr:hypothetical protein KALB_8050 [Kutzneria albida DSM 43870]MBA8931368.1 uncharacterized protein YgiM (DUF1202 family) [Kutzneria viridogrisea]